MKIKHLARQGNSLALIIDRPILDLADITEKTPLTIAIAAGTAGKSEATVFFAKNLGNVESPRPRALLHLNAYATSSSTCSATKIGKMEAMPKAMASLGRLSTSIEWPFMRM